MKEYRKEFLETKSEVSWISLRILPLVVIVIVVLGSIGWGLNLLSQPAVIVSKTMNADNVIYNYEYFHKQYEDYKAAQVKIQNQKQQIKDFETSSGDRKDWSFEDKTEYSRIQSILTGLKNYSEDIKAEFNARSKMVNRNIFKGTSVPETIE